MAAAIKETHSIAPVFALDGLRNSSGVPQDHITLPAALAGAMTEGTVTVGFTLDSLQGETTLLSAGDGDGLSIRVDDGTLAIDLGGPAGMQALTVSDVELGTEGAHTLALSYGDDGLTVQLDGQEVATVREFTGALLRAGADLTIGTSGGTGGVSDLQIFDRPLSAEEVAGTASDDSATVAARAVAPAPSQPMAATSGNPLNIDPVYSYMGTKTYTGSTGDYKNVSHKGALAVSNGTISMGFTLDTRRGDAALVSKDLNGGNEGDFTVWIRDGELIVEFQGKSSSEYLTAAEVVLDTHTAYHLALSFGKDGLQVFLNGDLVAAEPLFTDGLKQNDNSLIIGGTRAWASSNGDSAHSLFRGTISDVMLFDKQLDSDDMIALTKAYDSDLGKAATMANNMAELSPLFEQVHHGSDTLKEILADYGVSEHGHMMAPLNMITKGKSNDTIDGTEGADGIDGGKGNDTIDGLGVTMSCRAATATTRSMAAKATTSSTAVTARTS